MRAVFGLTLLLVSSAALAQQPATSSPAAGRTMVSAADVAALMAKAKVDRKESQALLAQSMIRLDPYNVSLEYRAAVANAAAVDEQSVGKRRDDRQQRTHAHPAAPQRAVELTGAGGEAQAPRAIARIADAMALVRRRTSVGDGRWKLPRPSSQ